jgi:two-component system sensor histidine kinase QseC
MEHLVQQILTLYRTTPDQFMATFAWLDLTALAQNIIAEHYDIFDKKSQSIELQGQACYLNGDQAALSILLLNLIENANKYTPQGGIIRVMLEEHSDVIILQVEDSGVGIDPSQYKRVFERFYRVDGDCHASNEVGCGIGLSIVKHIVDLHKADIHLQTSNFTTGIMVQIVFPKGEQHV